MPELIAEQRNDLWLAARKGRITASLAAACLGLDPHTSPQAAWRQITSDTKVNENRFMRWGTEFEGRARGAYEVESGNLVQQTGFWVHPTLDWLGASPDGLVAPDGLVEIKCPGKLPGGIPIHHAWQMAVQLAVTQRNWCDYFVWTQDRTAWERFMFPQSAWPDMLAQLTAFYETFIKTGVEPPRRKRRKKDLTTPDAPA